MTQKQRDEARKFDVEYIEHIIFAHLGISGSASTHLAEELFNQFNERLQTARTEALMEVEKVAMSIEPLMALEGWDNSDYNLIKSHSRYTLAYAVQKHIVTTIKKLRDEG